VVFLLPQGYEIPNWDAHNQATKEGFWKATDKDMEIFNPAGGGHELIGMKKKLVFYMGRAPRGSKTNWVMHEFCLKGMSRHNTNLRLSPKVRKNFSFFCCPSTYSSVEFFFYLLMERLRC
jgi:hypothetical protein